MPPFVSSPFTYQARSAFLRCPAPRLARSAFLLRPSPPKGQRAHTSQGYPTIVQARRYLRAVLTAPSRLVRDDPLRQRSCSSPYFFFCLQKRRFTQRSQPSRGAVRRRVVGRGPLRPRRPSFTCPNSPNAVLHSAHSPQRGPCAGASSGSPFVSASHFSLNFHSTALVGAMLRQRLVGFPLRQRRPFHLESSWLLKVSRLKLNISRTS